MPTTLHAIGIFSLCSVLIGLALFVILHNPGSKVNKLFALSVLTIVGWIAAISISLSSKHIQHTIILGRFAFAFASAMPFTLLYMFQAFPVPETRPRSLTLTLPGIFCAVFILLSFSPWIVTGAVPTTLRSQFLYGPIYPLFSAYTVSCFALAIYTLCRKIHLASGIKKLQLRYLLLGILLGGAGAMTTNLFIPLLWNTSRFSTLGPYFSLVMVTFSAHAIIRYRLMDIKVVIQKGVVYVSAIAVTAAIFLSFPTLLSSAIGHKMDSIPLGLAVAMAIVVAILFQPLKRLIQDSFNRYLYRQPYDYQRIVTQASQRLSTILDLKSLLRYLTDTIATTLNLEFAAVYISDDADQMFTPKAVYQPIGAERGAFDAPLPRNSDLVAYLERAKRLLLRDDPSDNSTLLHRLPALRALKTLGGDAAFPIVQDNRVAGVIAIGPKLSGDPLYTEDLNLLSTLVNQASIAIKNAQLYRQVVVVNEYIENILATMESGVITVNSDGKVTLFNSAAERMIGFDATDMKSSPLRKLPLSLANPLEGTLTDGLSRLQIETLLEDETGKFTPVICSTSPLKDRSKTILGAVAVFSDLTRIKELENEKRRAEHLASIGALASGIAHEIKNPLVAITTFAELLPERFGDEDFRGDFSKVVLQEIDRIDDLVARLRGLATPPAQSLSPLDLRGPIEDTLALLRGQLEQSRISVKRVYQRELPLVLGDPAQLKQLFLNLFINALEAMEPGGELSIHLARQEASDKQTLVAEVSDTGMGIPETLRGRIFDPFVTTKPRGSGLGLSICRGIADAHRGSIRVHNSEGRGTTVVIEFPAASHSTAILKT